MLAYGADNLNGSKVAVMVDKELSTIIIVVSQAAANSATK